MPDKLRVAIYCRVAGKNQMAIDHQEAALRAFAKEQGYGGCLHRIIGISLPPGSPLAALIA